MELPRNIMFFTNRRLGLRFSFLVTSQLYYHTNVDLSSPFFKFCRTKFLKGGIAVLYSRFLELCAEKKQAPSSVATSLGFSKNAFSRWKDTAEENNGFSSLRTDTLMRLADYFGVSTDYLFPRHKKPQYLLGFSLSLRFSW